MKTKLFDSVQLLPLEIQTVIFDYLNQDDLNSCSGIVNLRTANKYFYHRINLYWENIYAIKEIICGNCSSYILLKNGDLYVCGTDSHKYISSKLSHQDLILLTAADKLGYNKFKLVIPKIKKIATGLDMTLVLTEDNHVYGRGNSHNLGLNQQQTNLPFVIKGLKAVYYNSNQEHIYGREYSYNYTSKFEKLASNIIVKDLVVGANHILLLDNTGAVYGCGFNLYGQLGIGSDRNLEKFTKIFAKADKIFATDLNCFILSNDMLYGAGVNHNNIISSSIPDRELVTIMIPMNYLNNPNNLKKILNAGDLLCLYNDYKLYIVNAKQQCKLLASGVADIWYMHGMKRKVLFLLKLDGTLSCLGHPECYWLVPTSSYLLLNAKFFILCLATKLLGLTFINGWIQKIIANCTTLIAEHVDAGSCYGLHLYKHKNYQDGSTSYTRGLHLMFSREQGKRLYTAGIRCLNGQLGLPGHSTVGVEEVIGNLPIKNKLLQGRAIKSIFD